MRLRRRGSPSRCSSEARWIAQPRRVVGEEHAAVVVERRCARRAPDGESGSWLAPRLVEPRRSDVGAQQRADLGRRARGSRRARTDRRRSRTGSTRRAWPVRVDPSRSDGVMQSATIRRVKTRDPTRLNAGGRATTARTSDAESSREQRSTRDRRASHRRPRRGRRRGRARTACSWSTTQSASGRRSCVKLRKQLWIDRQGALPHPDRRAVRAAHDRAHVVDQAAAVASARRSGGPSARCRRARGGVGGPGRAARRGSRGPRRRVTVRRDVAAVASSRSRTACRRRGDRATRVKNASTLAVSSP